MLATYAWDDLGRRTSLTFGNGVVQAFTFDPVSRLASLTNNLSGTTNDLSATFAWNPASQIASTTRTGDTYAWTGHFNENVTGTPNGLNQLTAVGAKSLTHDARGNVTAFGTKAFTYSSENMLLTGPNSTALSYDPVMRLQQVTSGSTSKLAYDGLDRIAEYDAANALQRRYVHGPSVDEPIVWYEGSGTADRRFLSADERGSIVSVTDSAGTLLAVNRYDEFGNPQASNMGVWGYTGQAWLAGPGLWHYKARAYDPELGRFLQADPIGYEDSPNLYAYVGNDPANLSDPSGLCPEGTAPNFDTGSRIRGCLPVDKGGNVIGGGVASGFSPGIAWGGSGPPMMSSQGYYTYGPATQSGNDIHAIATVVRTWHPGESGFSNFHQAGWGSRAVGTRTAWINVTPQFLAHVRARHFGFDDSFVSKFDANFQSEAAVIDLASFAANSAPLRPTRVADIYTYTARHSGVVGYLMGTGQPTNLVTLVVRWTGAFDKAGRRVFDPVTMYPGRSLP